MNRRLVSNLALLLFTVTSPVGCCLGKNSRAQSALDTCHYSDQMYDSDASLMKRGEAPTHFRLMTSRYVSMVQAARGWLCTGTVTVGFDGHHYLQTGRSDDPGMMELIPTISRYLGRSIADSYDIAICAVSLSGIFIGFAGLCQLYTDRQLRAVGAVVFLCFGLAEARIADEYIFQISTLIAGLPWLLYLGIRQKNSGLAVSAALLAFCCSWCSLVRSGSLVICTTFLLTMFIARHRVQKPLLPLSLIILACIPSLLFERSLILRRDVALARVGETAKGVNAHPLWHTLYIGLGFIPNSEVPEYRDGVAGEKVRSIDPTVAYTSAKYQAILRSELWGIIKRRPMLVIGVFAAKAAIIILLAVILLYPARRLIFAETPSFWLDAAFLLTITMSAMNGIVAVPRASYLLTFVCLTILYTTIKRFESYEAQKRRVSPELLRQPQAKHPSSGER